MKDEDLFQAQRDLRQRLLDRPDAIRWSPAKDLAAHLLLRLDDPSYGWQLATKWLREALDADRVDGGYSHPADAVYTPQAESLRSDRFVPSLAEMSIDAWDPGVRYVWRSNRVVILGDIGQDRRLGADLRTQLTTLGTSVKMAVPIVDDGRPVGLLCADWMDDCSPAGDERWVWFDEVARSVLGPIFGMASRLAGVGMGAGGLPVCSASATVMDGLTPAERTVAALAAKGMSYKEIARHLNRSLSTVDHQLRSVREKLGVRSKGRLVRMLAEQALSAVN
ncbi:helix-turn-helix transcriptional regulator [Methylibium petroleiphilum]|uniref:helix-turn-helix transcriptional regulator n=1 Tax=Methylibium petroleiphilum TaxID=105560 RepID=UPI003D29E0C9